MKIILDSPSPSFILPPPPYNNDLIPHVPLTGSIQVSVPFDLYKIPENKSMKPAWLSLVFVGKSRVDNEVFYQSPAKRVWKRGATSSLKSGVGYQNVGVGSAKTDAIYVDPMVKPMEEQKEKGENVFEEAERLGKKFVTIPFYLRVPTILPPSLSFPTLPSSSTSTHPCTINPLEITDYLFQPTFSPNHPWKAYEDFPELILFPYYELQATLAFESFAVRAFQKCSVIVEGRTCVPRSWIKSDEQVKYEGFTTKGAFKYAMRLPRVLSLGSPDPLTFELKLKPSFEHTWDNTLITQIDCTVVWRFRKTSQSSATTIQTPFSPTLCHTSTTSFPPHKSSTTTSTRVFPLSIPLVSLENPDAEIGPYNLEHHLEIVISYTAPQSTSFKGGKKKVKTSLVMVPLRVVSHLPEKVGRELEREWEGMPMPGEGGDVGEEGRAFAKKFYGRFGKSERTSAGKGSTPIQQQPKSPPITSSQPSTTSPATSPTISVTSQTASSQPTTTLPAASPTVPVIYPQRNSSSKIPPNRRIVSKPPTPPNNASLSSVTSSPPTPSSTYHIHSSVPPRTSSSPSDEGNMPLKRKTAKENLDLLMQLTQSESRLVKTGAK
ncbi:hypothetical protein HDV05_001807 [Chytridiales sp. JEL 0842]|nr:hypothetical protein HDV05_001807 [Chytridiales sp. JEL 0842]